MYSITEQDNVDQLFQDKGVRHDKWYEDKLHAGLVFADDDEYFPDYPELMDKY